MRPSTRTTGAVRVRRELPGNVIVIHGVNDVGTSFGALEKGLCQGLDARMYGLVMAATHLAPSGLPPAAA